MYGSDRAPLAGALTMRFSHSLEKLLVLGPEALQRIVSLKL